MVIIPYRDSARLRFGCLIIQHHKILAVKDSRYSKLTLPGGKLECDETPNECFTRELKEELNCEFQSARFFGAYVSKENGIDRINAAFIVKIKGDPQPNSEIERIEWLTAKDIDKFGPVTAKIVQDAINKQLIR